MQQEFDERNRDLLININGELLHRDRAGISPFDSAVQGGDAVWEGLRLYHGRIFKLTEHLQRLRDSAEALAFAEIPRGRKDHRGNQTHAGRERDARRRAHSVDPDARSESDVGDGPAA